MQVNRSRTPSKDDDELPRTSVKVNTDQSIPIDYPINMLEKIIPTESLLSPISSKSRMKYANVTELNDIEWEVPGEFRTIFQTNDERTPPTILDSRLPRTWQREANFSQSDYLWKDDITQQQAFEY